MTPTTHKTFRGRARNLGHFGPARRPVRAPINPRRGAAMGYDFGPRGIGNASSASLTEWLLVCAAAVETILVAVLALIVAGVGEGSGAVATLARCNALLLAPLRFLPASLSAAVRQGTA